MKAARRCLTEFCMHLTNADNGVCAWCASGRLPVVVVVVHVERMRSVPTRWGARLKREAKA